MLILSGHELANSATRNLTDVEEDQLSGGCWKICSVYAGHCDDSVLQCSDFDGEGNEDDCEMAVLHIALGNYCDWYCGDWELYEVEVCFTGDHGICAYDYSCDFDEALKKCELDVYLDPEWADRACRDDFGGWGTWHGPVLWMFLDNESAAPNVGKAIHINSRDL